ncbi:MAG: chemotaxis protein CheX [Desulfobacterales bacterium]
MTDIQRILSETGASTLEQLAFLFSFPEDDDRLIDAATSVGCRIGFSGPESGELLIAFSSAVLPELASNMLGTEDEGELDPMHLQDALKEAGNVICGNVLPKIFGREAVFDLEPPEFIPDLRSGSQLAAISSSPETSRSRLLSLDGGECQLFLNSNR